MDLANTTSLHRLAQTSVHFGEETAEKQGRWHDPPFSPPYPVLVIVTERRQEFGGRIALLNQDNTNNNQADGTLKNIFAWQKQAKTQNECRSYLLPTIIHRSWCCWTAARSRRCAVTLKRVTSTLFCPLGGGCELSLEEDLRQMIGCSAAMASQRQREVCNDHPNSWQTRFKPQKPAFDTFL